MSLSLFEGVRYNLPDNSIWLFGSIVTLAVLTLIVTLLTSTKRGRRKESNHNIDRDQYRQINDEKKFMRMMAKQKRDSERFKNSSRTTRKQRNLRG